MTATAVGQTAAAPTDNPGFTIRSRTELVVVNLTARDRNGNMVRDLKAEDFTVLEENKQQQIASFDIETTDAVALPEAAQVQLLKTAPAESGSGATPATASDAFRNHRLIVLFFDLSSMEPDEIDRAAQAGLKYVDKQMAPADLVSVVSLGNALQVNQDFTADHALLTQALRAFTAGSSEGFDAFRMLRGRDIFLRRSCDRMRAGHFGLVEMMGVIENEKSPHSSLLQIFQQLLVAAPLIFSLFRFRCLPGKIHSDKFESGGSDQIKVPFMAGDEMDIDANAGRQNWIGNFRGRAAKKKLADQRGGKSDPRQFNGATNRETPGGGAAIKEGGR